MAAGFDAPLLLVGADDGSGDRYVVEQRGRVLRLRADGTPDEAAFLDIRDRVLHHHERGLLGLAFHPDYADNGRFYVTYSRRDDGATTISEFSVAQVAAEEGSAEPGSIADTERTLLDHPSVLDHAQGRHAGLRPRRPCCWSGSVMAAPAMTPTATALDRASLLGKLLRLDVDRGWPYATPLDNGFAEDREARPEVHAIGLRNPWRFSVDRESGDLYIGDVGQGDWEEIDVLPRGTRAASFGWTEMEGPDCFYGRDCDPTAHTSPRSWPTRTSTAIPATAASSAAMPIAVRPARCRPGTLPLCRLLQRHHLGPCPPSSCGRATPHRPWSASVPAELGLVLVVRRG